MLPPLDDLLDRMHVVAVPMRVRFRGITIREVALFDGPAGWGEFGAFVEYEPPEAAHWLASGIESAFDTKPVARRDRIPINAFVPAVPAGQIPDLLARFPGAGTGRVKVAEPGQTLADDVVYSSLMTRNRPDSAGPGPHRQDAKPIGYQHKRAFFRNSSEPNFTNP